MARISVKARRMMKRRLRVRSAVRGGGRPRLIVSRSLSHVYAQVIDDDKGATVAFASSLDKTLAGAGGKKVDASRKVGELIASRAKAAGVTKVAFDRAGRSYHGRIKAVAEGARASGLEF